jgi:hypothetical protein
MCTIDGKHKNQDIKLQPYHPTCVSIMKLKTIMMNAMSYDVLIGGSSLYPMGFPLNL